MVELAKKIALNQMVINEIEALSKSKKIIIDSLAENCMKRCFHIL